MPRRPHSGESGVATAIAGLACPTAAPSARLPRSAILVTLRRLLTDVPLDAAIAKEEIFGPVVVVEAVDTPEDVIAAANRTVYGLTSSILAGDTYKGDGAQGSCRNRGRQFANCQRRDPRADGRSSRQRLGAVQDRPAWMISAM